MTKNTIEYSQVSMPFVTMLRLFKFQAIFDPDVSISRNNSSKCCIIGPNAINRTIPKAIVMIV